MDNDRIEPAGKQANESVIGNTALHKAMKRAKFFRKQAKRLFELASECPEHHLRDQLFALANEYVGLADAPAQADYRAQTATCDLIREADMTPRAMTVIAPALAAGPVASGTHARAAQSGIASVYSAGRTANGERAP